MKTLSYLVGLPLLVAACGDDGANSTAGAGGQGATGGASGGKVASGGATSGGVSSGANGGASGGGVAGIGTSATGGAAGGAPAVGGGAGGVTGGAFAVAGTAGGVTGGAFAVAGTAGGVTGGATAVAGTAGGVTGGAAGTGGVGTGGTSSTDVTVQLARTRQIIQGFGINSALMPGGVTFPVDDLFGTEGPDGIGLSILRVGMTPEGTLTGGFIDEARSYGARIIGSTWSPPANCKSDGTTVDGGYLITPDEDGGVCYDSWSTTIANFAQQYDLYGMSIANESDFASCPGVPVCTVSYDTTTYTAKQMVEWVKVAGPKLRAVGVKVIAPEASLWLHVWSNASPTGSLVAEHPHSSDPLDCGCYSNTPTEEGCAQHCLDGDGYDYGHWLWNDQEAWNAFDILGVHEYESQVAYPWPADVNSGVRDREVWQTEMSGVMHWPEQGPSIDIDNGVAVAGWIHSALTVGEASAWLYWWYEAYYENDNEGLALIQGSSTIAKRYYTLGNYSKFVRPGYVAVDVTGEIPADVLLSAYNGDAGAVVVVAINKGSAAVDVPITIAGGTAPASMTPWVTSASDNLVSQAAVPVTGGTFVASLPGTSVTTFVSQ